MTAEAGDADTSAVGCSSVLSPERAAVSTRATWRETARIVADELERHLSSPDVFPKGHFMICNDWRLDLRA